MGQKGGAGQRRSASSGGGSAASATSEGDIAAARFGHYSGDDPRRAVTRASRSGPSFSGISTLAGGALSGSLGAEGSEKEAEAAYSRAGTPGAIDGFIADIRPRHGGRARDAHDGCRSRRRDQARPSAGHGFDVRSANLPRCRGQAQPPARRAVSVAAARAVRAFPSPGTRPRSSS